MYVILIFKLRRITINRLTSVFSTSIYKSPVAEQRLALPGTGPLGFAFGPSSFGFGPPGFLCLAHPVLCGPIKLMHEVIQFFNVFDPSAFVHGCLTIIEGTMIQIWK